MTPAVGLDPDVYPVTARGRSFVVMVIVIGVLFLAMPLSTVGANFNAVWQERQLVKLQRLVRQLLMENNMSAEDAMVAFQQFDTDGSGTISYSEFCHFLSEVLGLHIPKRELKKLWNMVDMNGSNEIDFVEFSDAIFPNHRHIGEPPVLSPQQQRQKAAGALQELKRVSERISAGQGAPAGGSALRPSSLRPSSLRPSSASPSRVRLTMVASLGERMAALEEQVSRLADTMAKQADSVKEEVVALSSWGSTSGEARVSDIRRDVQTATERTNALLVALTTKVERLERGMQEQRREGTQLPITTHLPGVRPQTVPSERESRNSALLGA